MGEGMDEVPVEADWIEGLGTVKVVGMWGLKKVDFALFHISFHY
jgi:hypothetical protein